ncbi:hypothetical protein WJX74_000843 [Apatococcus lobatus]|uniref:Magnesium transporter n=1 Tax=Apatococcus lobatus TaxID=904363 RepID=A0AAW1RH05_9CHLO
MSFRLPNKPAPRDKGMGTQQRNWIRINRDGGVSSVQLRQHQLMQQFGVQPRDLRLLDVLVATSYPSAILSRDSAIVVNLERFKCIITTDVVLLPAALFSDGPDAFLQELQQRLCASGSARAKQPFSGNQGQVPVPDQPRAAGSDLPFELCALEVCLEACAQHLGECTRLLEERAGPFYEAPHPAKINSEYLEAIKVIKTRCVRLKTRAETVKEVLQKYLDDEDDLKDLHLSARLGKAAPWNTESALWEQIEEQLHLQAGHDSTSGTQLDLTPAVIALLSDPEKEQAAVAERVLRPYLMHLDQIVERLIDINDHIEDTEEYMGLSLNTTRNVLVWLRVMVNSASLLTTMLFALGNLFGQNLGNHNAAWSNYYGVFLAVSISMGVGVTLLYCIFVAWLQSTVNKAFVGGSFAPVGWARFKRAPTKI